MQEGPDDPSVGPLNTVVLRRTMMSAIYRAAWGTGLALATCVMCLPANAIAQGKYPKPAKVERKIERKTDQTVGQKKVYRTTRKGTVVARRRILCGDGT